MKCSKKIFRLWFVLIGGVALTYILLPSQPADIVSVLNYSVQLLLFVVSVWITRHEPTQKNKSLFINFALLFGMSVGFHVYNFVGRGALLFPEQDFARLYFAQYFSLAGYFLMMAVAIGYVTVDLLFRDYRTYQKYLITFVIVGGFFAWYYHPYFVDPKYSHHTQDVLDFKTIDRANIEFMNQFGYEPSPEELAASTEMYVWKDGKEAGVLYPDEKLQRVKELYRYLPDQNYKVLVYRPLYMNAIYMSVLCIGFILLFFGYQYMKDPPQGAYIEKIMFLFLVFCTMEVLHAWSFVKSVEWQTFADTMAIGQYVTISILLLIGVFLGLRLRFITSAKGEFYENELAVSPAAVTRWRDALDNIVVEKFFNRKMILGRLFVDPSDKAVYHHRSSGST